MGLYEQLSAVSYAAEWGETLYDFFLPETAEAPDYGADSSYYLPFVAAMTEGQRGSLQFLSLQACLCRIVLYWRTGCFRRHRQSRSGHSLHNAPDVCHKEKERRARGAGCGINGLPLF